MGGSKCHAFLLYADNATKTTHITYGLQANLNVYVILLSWSNDGMCMHDNNYHGIGHPVYIIDRMVPRRCVDDSACDRVL